MDYAELADLTQKIAYWERRIMEIERDIAQGENDLVVAKQSRRSFIRSFNEIIKNNENNGGN